MNIHHKKYLKVFTIRKLDSVGFLKGKLPALVGFLQLMISFYDFPL
jgi:hypothetical protein